MVLRPLLVYDFSERPLQLFLVGGRVMQRDFYGVLLLAMLISGTAFGRPGGRAGGGFFQGMFGLSNPSQPSNQNINQPNNQNINQNGILKGSLAASNQGQQQFK